MCILLFLFLYTTSLLSLEGHLQVEDITTDDTQPFLQEMETRECLICFEAVEEIQPHFFLFQFFLQR